MKALDCSGRIKLLEIEFIKCRVGEADRQDCPLARLAGGRIEDFGRSVYQNVIYRKKRKNATGNP